MLKDRNTEGTENNPDFAQRSNSEIVVTKDTETSPSNSLAVLHVAGAEESTVKGDKVTSGERVVISSQECLMSRSDDGSEGLEKFLRDKLDSFGGEGLYKIVEVDPAVVLELLADNLVDHGRTVKNVVAVDEEMSRSRVDDVLLLELLEKAIGSLGKRPLCDVDVGAVDERPSKSVAFQLDNVGGRLSSGECGLVGVADAGQSFQVVPDRMTLIMVHLNWSPLHESELTLNVRRGFGKLQD